MKSILYLAVVLVSLFLLLPAGAAAGGVVLSPAGDVPALFGAVAGAVVGLCAWFRVVGHLVELEDSQLKGVETPAAPETPRRADAAHATSAGDVRLGNHMMVSGVVTFLSSLFGPPGAALLFGVLGVALVAAGFIISLAGVEFASEEGLLRKVKLLVARPRT